MVGPPRRRTLARVACTALLLAGGLALALPALSPAAQPVTPGSTCVGGTTPAHLTALFDREPGGLLGTDYQRALQLPDGRVLWTFQDAVVRSSAGEATVVSNVAMIQNGSCFDLLVGGTPEEPASWMFAGETTPFVHWFWPLDATMGHDGNIWVFFAEMRENGPEYLTMTEPIGTRVAILRPGDLQVVSLTRPPNSSAALYGFSITDDDDWTYLYAQCHRQFGWDPFIFGPDAHDLSCSANVTVGRVPRGSLHAAPRYWDGSSWQASAARAVPVMPKGHRLINPTQVEWNGEEFLAVTKEGDWFGRTIYIDRAPAAQGPWSAYARVPAIPKCAPNVCNTYFASLIPPVVAGGNLTLGLSHNLWNGQLSPVYRPTFIDISPPGRFPLAMRCSLVDC